MTRSSGSSGVNQSRNRHPPAAAPTSAAAEAGLQVGDVIVEVNRLAVRDAAQFREMVRGANGSLLLLIQRGGNTQFITVRPR